MSYDAIDERLHEWARGRAISLLREFEGAPRRFFYVSHSRSESFQVSIAPPASGRVIINAWSIETDDDQDLHAKWDVDPADLMSALDGALSQIKLWEERKRR